LEKNFPAYCAYLTYVLRLYFFLGMVVPLPNLVFKPNKPMKMSYWLHCKVSSWTCL